MVKGLYYSLKRSPKKEIITKIQLQINNSVVVVSAVTDAIGFGSIVLGGLPEGYLKIVSSVLRLQLSGSGSDGNLIDTWSGDFSVGSTPASDATISLDDENIIASTAVGPAVAEVSPLQTIPFNADFVLDNTAANLELNLNVLIDAADIADSTSVTLTAVGLLEVTLITMLDD